MFVVNHKHLIVRMDFRIVDLHKSMMVDNLNRSYTVVDLIAENIERMDFRIILVNMCKRVDGFFLRSEHSEHMNQYHRPYGIPGSIDRMLHRPNNLHCIGKFLVHMKSMGFLVFRPGKCNWLDDFVLSILHRVHIVIHRMCMD